MKTLSKDEIRKFVLDHPHYYKLLPHEMKVRMGNENYSSVKQIQQDFIDNIYQPLTKDELIFLKPFVAKANENLKRILKPLRLDKKPIETVIIKTVDGKDWQMPYTKANVIVLPQRVINANMRLARTLTHEKLHIYQRMFPDIFKKYYKQQLDFDSLKLNDNQLQGMKNMGLHKMMINNPDITDMGLMVYKSELLPLTVIMPNETKPVNIIVRLLPDGIILENNKKGISGYDELRLDHPNEMMAYMVCK